MSHPGTENLPDWLAISEPYSSFSHLLGSAGALVATFFLLHHARGRLPRLVSFAIFGFVTSATLALSGIYHFLEPGTTARVVFQRMDHAAIWLMIAATFTPIHRLLFDGFARWGVLLIVWISALLGIALKTVFFHSIPNWVGVLAYCVLGSIGFWSYVRIRARFGPWLERPFYWAGMFYVLGALFEGSQAITLIPGVIGPHELMHTAALIGIVFQWVMMVRVADLLAAQDKAKGAQKRRMKRIRDRVGITGSGPVGDFRQQRARRGQRTGLIGRFWRRRKKTSTEDLHGVEESFKRKRKRPYWRPRVGSLSSKRSPDKDDVQGSEA